MEKKSMELSFDEDTETKSTIFASGVALALLAQRYKAESDEPVDIAMLDCFVRENIASAAKQFDLELDDGLSYERTYLEFVSKLLSDVSGENSARFIEMCVSASATHFSKSKSPVIVAVIESEMTVPAEWVEEQNP